MTTKTAILVPGTTGLYEGVYKVARIAASKKKAVVTSSISKIESLAKSGKITKVLIIMGARDRGKYLNAPDAYLRLKCRFGRGFGIECVVMDGWEWPNIPVILLPGENTIKLISQQL